jgi:hypothetical protein
MVERSVQRFGDLYGIDYTGCSGPEQSAANQGRVPDGESIQTPRISSWKDARRSGV